MIDRTRLRGSAAAAVFGTVVTATDLLPPAMRYGYAHRATRRLFGGGLPRIPAVLGETAIEAMGHSDRPGDLTCVLATQAFEVGGIGSVIEMLAGHLAAQGVRPVVVCEYEGQRSQRLRQRGIKVIAVNSRDAADVLRAAAADVIQLHNAPQYLERAAIESGLPLIPVLHNTEIHFTGARWASVSNLVRNSAATVAVSEVVREFHVRHVGPDLADKFTVIPNGAPAFPSPGVVGRLKARRAIERALGTQLGESVIFLSLARYDAQKNISGLVAGFLRAAASSEHPIHLVIAGEPSDWAEVRRARGIQLASSDRDHVHLLGNSDARTLLAAADVFILDSFFEGWPVAATEAFVAGLPLVLSDVGGARELVAHDARSVLISNACGPAGEVTDARVGAARRRSRQQANHEQLAAAIHSTASAVRSDVNRRTRAVAPSAASAGPGVMAAAHARVMRAAVARWHSAGMTIDDPIASDTAIDQVTGGAPAGAVDDDLRWPPTTAPRGPRAGRSSGSLGQHTGGRCMGHDELCATQFTVPAVAPKERS